MTNPINKAKRKAKDMAKYYGEDRAMAKLNNESPAQEVHMKRARAHPDWRMWFDHWVIYDCSRQAFIGFAPDMDEIASNHTLEVFIQQFFHASTTWTVENA